MEKCLVRFPTCDRFANLPTDFAVGGVRTPIWKSSSRPALEVFESAEKTVLKFIENPFTVEIQ